MLDLFRSQKKTVKYVLTALLSLVALSMVVTLIPNLFSTPAGPDEGPVLVEVGDEEVTIYDVNAVLQDYQRAGTPAEGMAFMAQQVVDNLVDDHILMQEAARLGVKPTDQELALHLKDQMPFLWEGGVFNQLQYQQMISQRFSISVPEFEKRVLQDLAVNTRLRQIVTDNIVMTDQELRELFEQRNERIQVDYATLEAASFASGVNPTGEEIQEYFEQNKFRYRIPERRTVKLVTLDPSTAAPPEFSDAEIQTFYNQNRYRFETPERVLAKHMLFMTTDPNEPSGAEKEGEALEAVKTNAEAALARVNGGEEFTAVAKELSEDLGTKEEGGDLGWVVRGQMPFAEFDQALFALPAGGVSELVKTELGYHIIYAEKKDPALTRPLEDVRQEIIADLAAEREQIARIERADEVTAAMRNAGDDVESVARERNLPVAVFEDIDRQRPPAGLAADPVFLGQIFSTMTPGEVLASAAEQRTMIAKVTSITPSRDAELAEVRDQVRADVVQSKSRELAQQRAQELFDKAQAGSLEAAARSLGLRVTKSDLFPRTGGVEDLAPAETLGERAFSAEVGAVLGPVSSGDRFGVYRIAAKEPADVTMFLDQRDELKGEFLEAKREEAFNIFRSLVRQRYEKDGKIKRYPARIEQMVRSIRTS